MDSYHKKYILDNVGRKTAGQIARELGIKERKVKKFLETHKDKRPEKEAAHPAAGGMKIRKTAIFYAVLIVLAVAAAYSNSIDGQFVWDDQYLVQNNIYIKDNSRIGNIFTEDFGAGGGKHYGFFRPLQVFSYVLDYSLWKLDVRGYHLMNIFLHVTASLGVFWLITALFGDTKLSFLASALFAVHPAHAEAVDYISGRGDPLCVTFITIAFVMYVFLQRKDNTLRCAAMIFSYLAALFTKEGGMILPFLLVVYHVSFREKIKPKYFITVLALTVVYLAYRLVFVKASSLDVAAVGTVLRRLPGFFVAITNYFRILFLPLDLHIEYGQDLYGLAHPKAVVGIVLAASLVSAALLRGKKNPLFCFSVLWFFAALLPVSNLYPIAFYMADHYLYLPSVGFFILLADALLVLMKNPRVKWIGMFLASALFVFYAVLTYRQNLYWKTALYFYERTLKYAPDSVRMNNELGRLYDFLGRNEEALARYKKAVELQPGYAYGYNNIGVIYNKIGRFAEALLYFEKALSLLPAYPDALNNIAVAYAELGRHEESVNCYKKAIELYPNFAGAYSNLGTEYGKIGRKDEGAAMYRRAIEIDPNFANAYFNLALYCEEKGDLPEAIKLMEKAAAIQPSYMPLYLKMKEKR